MTAWRFTTISDDHHTSTDRYRTAGINWLDDWLHFFTGPHTLIQINFKRFINPRSTCPVLSSPSPGDQTQCISKSLIDTYRSLYRTRTANNAFIQITDNKSLRLVVLLSPWILALQSYMLSIDYTELECALLWRSCLDLVVVPDCYYFIILWHAQRDFLRE